MSKKLAWSRNYSEAYLAAIQYRELTFTEHGLLKIINDILWTQTDIKGKYIIDGRTLDRTSLLHSATLYTPRHRLGRNDYLTCALLALFKAHALEQDKDGVIYSPFIVKEVEKIEAMAKRGKRGGSPLLNPKDNPKDKVEDRRIEKERETEEEREGGYPSIDSIRESYPRPTAAAMGRKQRQVEVLNFLESRPATDDHPSGGTLYLIGQYVPDQIISSALSSTREKKPKQPTAYYLAAIRNECQKQGIQTPIQWNGTPQRKEP